MSFSDLFDSGFKDRNKSHFASIVRVALSDGAITEEEKTFLDRVAIHLEISEYPINPPVLHVQRLERLYDLSRMVYADHILGPKQHAILTRFGLALGFTPSNIKYIVDKALSLLILNVDLDTFLYEMQHMNK